MREFLELSPTTEKRARSLTRFINEQVNVLRVEAIDVTPFEFSQILDLFKYISRLVPGLYGYSRDENGNYYLHFMGHRKVPLIKVDDRCPEHGEKYVGRCYCGAFHFGLVCLQCLTPSCLAL